MSLPRSLRGSEPETTGPVDWSKLHQLIWVSFGSIDADDREGVGGGEGSDLLLVVFWHL